MNLREWYRKRGIEFILKRAKSLISRYGFGPKKSIDRIESCVEALRSLDCYPTFAVPGIVVENNQSFIQRLQDVGVEIAVHGYNHVDLKAYPPDESSRQLQHGAQIFQLNGLEVHGFRCPYLSATDDLLRAIPHGVFEYSSNKAIQWTIDSTVKLQESLMFETIKGFYVPGMSDSLLCLPWFQDGLVEIPVVVPDDLQLHDGLGLDFEQISRVWFDILHQTHQRGEVFNLMFHPELASLCEAPFLRVLQEARSLHPGVWVARLRDISAWWKEKSTFRVEIERLDDEFTLKFQCTPRATILYRGLDLRVPTNHWDKQYWRLETRDVKIDSPILPFIGLPPRVPQWISTALQGMGYILDMGETARRCSLFIDEACLSRFDNPVDLIAYIEGTPEPLVRFWPWPDGMRSALCISGDLDALSLFDYAVRILKR